MKIEWNNEKRKVKDLIPADYNPRILLPKDRQDLEESIKKFNDVEPVIINIGNRNNVLVGGHQRISIYADLEKKEIDVRVPNRELTIEEETELNLRLNKNVGSWDWGKLKDFEVNKLLQVGFGDEELSDMWDDVGTFDDDYNVNEKIKEIKTTTVKPGEIYKLGRHRLMCGDSIDDKQVKQLMDGEKAEMIYCDPPYNIGMDYNWGMGELYHNKKNYGGEHDRKADKQKPVDYNLFIKTSIENAIDVAKEDVHVFYWCDQNSIWMTQQIFKENKLTLKRVCLWVKNNMNLKPQTAFNKVYEPVVYATRGKPFLNKGMTKLHEILNKEVETGNKVYDEIMDYFDLWLVARDVDYQHPTQKPVTLHEKPIKRCTAPGHLILDLFGGSGSTLLACDQLNRTCYMMEKDPIFCQVIINRYEQATGNKAIKI